MKLSLPCLLYMLFTAGSLANGAEPHVLDAAQLDALRVEVRTNHPTVASARARLRSAEAAIRGVRLWEDPQVGTSVMAAEPGMRRDDGDLMFGIEQMLPRPRLHEAQRARAGAERATAEAEARAAALTLEAQVAQFAIDLALMDERLAIQTNQLGWMVRMTENAREKLKEPMGMASEALRLESELAMERQKLDALRRQRTRLVGQLNILLGRALDFDWPELRLPGSPGPVPVLADELARLYQTNPMLQALLHMTEAAKSEMEITRRERSPIFAVGVDSAVYSGGDFRKSTFGVKMSLPWFNTPVYNANTERARHLQSAAEKETEALERRMRGEAVAAHTEAETSAREARTLSEEVIPRIQKAVDSTQNAWISSKAGLLEVLEARRALLNARLEERRAVAMHRRALEMLRSIVPPSTQP